MREMIFMNNQFSGPELHIDRFVLHNYMPSNTTIQFHGVEQRNTPWSDGVPGPTQKPIQPGRSWTYRLIAYQYGTYWYHAHARGDVSDDLYGPIKINPGPDVPQPFHLISNNMQDIEAMQKAEKNP
ncbi:Multicopper oxidase type 2 [Penicillium coprophilum]|uniref:Multicopper oxidase type 2 n=1 Tax=Penicillium coprophilum TaxID=36646 RepID=UPI00238ACC98|nr:Multicopper oxidase type 2 [Penicillium coprophilum]KAJ5165528.1 Multicopper oxidase type 2 [Penicillium coprophilum]